MKKILCSLGLFLVLVLTFALAPVKATTEECAHENLKFQYYLEGQTQPTTCLEEGIAKFVCEDCGASKYQKVSGEHSYKETVEDATCTTPQKIVVKCEHCNDVKTEEVLSGAVAGRMSFQRAFMAGEMTMKGDFGILRTLDQIFTFAK